MPPQGPPGARRACHRLAGLCLLAVAARAAPARAADAATVLARLRSVYEAHRTVAARVEQEMVLGNQPFRTVGRLHAAGGSMAMSLHMALPGALPLLQRVVTTRETVWIYVPGLNVAGRVDLARVRAEAPDPALRVLDSALGLLPRVAPFGLEHVGAETHAGVPTEHFRLPREAIPRPLAQRIPGLPGGGALDAWIGVVDGVPRMVQLLDGAGAVRFQLRFSQIALDAPLPPEVFVFTAPANVQVLDLTDRLLALWRGEPDRGAQAGPAAAGGSPGRD